MKNERLKGMDVQFTDAELDMFADYTDALMARKNPDIEEYLKRCPGSEAKMRPILETSRMLDCEVKKFKTKYPHVDLGKLLDLKHETKARPK
jgi:hypothetical protein